jgi:hypothetical protein
VARLVDAGDLHAFRRKQTKLPVRAGRQGVDMEMGRRVVLRGCCVRPRIRPSVSSRAPAIWVISDRFDFHEPSATGFAGALIGCSKRLVEQAFGLARQVTSYRSFAGLVWRTSGRGVRREKAALSSGCKSHRQRSSRKQPERLWPSLPSDFFHQLRNPRVFGTPLRAVAMRGNTISRYKMKRLFDLEGRQVG